MKNELSVWEIAHRWHGIDSVADQAPYRVLDTIRWLCAAVDDQQLVAVDYRIAEGSGETVWERLPSFFRAERAGQLDRALLDAVFIWNKNLEQFCISEGVELPSFWFGKGGSSGPNIKSKIGNSQEDRIRCRTIAEILWTENPQLTIPEIEKHSLTQRVGNAAQYKGKNTIRNWISDLNPKPPDKRQGRPKNTKK